jgi:hypothetical protein
LTKMSVIENTIPKTIPVTTVFMEGSLVGPQSQKHVKRLFEFIARGIGIVKHLFELSSTYPLPCFKVLMRQNAESIVNLKFGGLSI